MSIVDSPMPSKEARKAALQWLKSMTFSPHVAEIGLTYKEGEETHLPVILKCLLGNDV